VLHESEELIEETFVGQVCLSRKVKYIMTFIYNAYSLWMLVRTNQKKEMYDLHQSSEEGVEPIDSNSLEAALRELRKETALRIHHSRAKWIGNNEKFDCNIYAIELNIRENPQ